MLGDALAAWLAFLASLGLDVPLQPPAAEQAIAAAEAEIGFAFPEDLRALYRIADGQRDPLTLAETPGTRGVGPLFGRHSFSPLREALADYRTWLEIYEEAGADFAATYNWTRARPGHPVHGDYWRPGWFPFASDSGGNFYAVDLSPAEGGTYGQVIVIGRDDDERRVLAPSLRDFLLAATRRRPAIADRDGRWMSLDMEAGG
jgi:cell wall assembly regulator SMI1